MKYTVLFTWVPIFSRYGSWHHAASILLVVHECVPTWEHTDFIVHMVWGKKGLTFIKYVIWTFRIQLHFGIFYRGIASRISWYNFSGIREGIHFFDSIILIFNFSVEYSIVSIYRSRIVSLLIYIFSSKFQLVNVLFVNPIRSRTSFVEIIIRRVVLFCIISSWKNECAEFLLGEGNFREKYFDK